MDIGLIAMHLITNVPLFKFAQTTVGHKSQVFSTSLLHLHFFPVLESRPLEIDTDGNDSAFEDWESCSRTTPNNHKSIRKWRQQSQPGGGGGPSRNPPSTSSTPSSNPAMTPISILTSSPLETNGGGPLSAPSVIHSWPHQKGNGSFSPSDSLFTSPASSSTSNSDLKRRLKSETVTSPESVSSMEDNKPIGIAVGRPREGNNSLTDSGHETSTDKSSLEDSGIELKRPAPPPRPSPVSGLLPPLSPLDCVGIAGLRQPAYWPLPFMAASPPAHQPMSGAYPVATKDLYPAMYLYNGFGPLAAAASMWPQPASAFGATPFQQSLIQLQQESWLASARHGNNGFLFNSQPPQESPSPPRRPAAPRPSVARTPSPVLSPKENGHDHEDNVSVGGPNDELDETCSETTNTAVKEASSKMVKVKVESLKAEKSEDDTSGLQLLTEGIDRLEHSSPRKPSVQEPSNSSQVQPRRSNKLGILCDAAFLSDDEAHLRSDNLSSNGADSSKARSRSLDSPNKKPRTLSSEYRSPKAERNAKAFIASKSLKVSEDLHHLETASSQEATTGSGVCSNNGLATDRREADSKMADWERNLRLNLADIQKKYKEKYKELQVINKKSFTKTPKKSHEAKKTLAPITPWLHKLKNGQHHHQHQTAGSGGNLFAATGSIHAAAGAANNVTDKKGNKLDSLSSNNGNKGFNSLQQPKGPDLSTITSKFRSARPNPFENLLKLSCVGKKTQEGVKKTEEEISEEPTFATSTPKANSNATPDDDVVVGEKSDINSSKQVEDLKRLPKLDLVQDDHADADVSEVEDEEDGPPVLEPMLDNGAASEASADKPKNNITVKIKRPSSETDSSGSTHSRSKKSKKEKKAKKAKKERHHHHHHRDHHHHHHKKHHHDGVPHTKPSVVHFNDNDADVIQTIDLIDAGIITKKEKSKTKNSSDESKKPIKEVFIEGTNSLYVVTSLPLIEKDVVATLSSDDKFL